MKYAIITLLLTISMCSKKDIEDIEKSLPAYYAEFTYNGKYYGFSDDTHFVRTEQRQHQSGSDVYRYSELSFFSDDPAVSSPDFQLIVMSKFGVGVDVKSEYLGPVNSSLDPALTDADFYIAPMLHSQPWAAYFERDGEEWSDLVFVSAGEDYAFGDLTCFDAEIEFNVFANAPSSGAQYDVYVNLYTEGKARVQICR